MTNHISRQRQHIAQEKIIAKSRILEDYLQNGIPENVYIPNNLKEFRLWKDLQLKLEVIGSPNTINRPYNQALKSKINELLKALLNRKKQKQKRAKIIESLQIQIKEKDCLIKHLAGQWHSTRQQLVELQTIEIRLLGKIDRLNRQVAELTRKLNTVIPFKILEK